MSIRSTAALTVFVASPGGLDDERATVESVAGNLNAGAASQANVSIRVRRFEQLVGQAGNPQSQINAGIDECDIFIGIVHRRWGSDTGNGFDSGFGEEYARPLARWKKTGEPRIAIFFKQIDADSITDPGVQLKKVLEFRTSLETKHEVFYSQFATTGEFGTLVTQLLAEELMAIPRSSPGEGSQPAQGLPSKQLAAENNPISEETAAVLGVFSDLMAGRGVTGRIDTDRLELFALAASKDHDLMSSHLANRLFLRRDEIVLSGVERAGWFRTYVNDLGRADSASNRVIPFADAAGGRDAIDELVMTVDDQFLKSEDGWFTDGYLRLLTALKLRPKYLWPSTPLNDAGAERYTTIWSHPASSSSSRRLVIAYWLSTHRARDLTLARALQGSSDDKVSELGGLLAALFARRPNATLLAAALPEMLVEDAVRDLFDSSNPFATLSAEVLESIALREYGTIDLRLCALDELIDRDDVPDKVFLSTLKGPGIGSILGGAWAQAASERIYDREVSVPFITRMMAAFAGTLAAPETAPKAAIRTFIARLARHNEHVASVFPTAVEVEGSFSTERAEWLFRRHEATILMRRVAEAILAGTYAPANEYVAGLEGVGAAPATLSFVRGQFETSALRYLSYLPQPRQRRKHIDRIRAIAQDDGFWRYDELESLLNVFEDQDIDLLVERGRVMNEVALQRTVDAVVKKASLSRLQTLVSSENTSFAVAALNELERRKRPLSTTKLTSLLRDERSPVRMTALSILTDGASDSFLRALVTTYYERPGMHYYNVVCELDRILSRMPPTHPYAK